MKKLNLITFIFSLALLIGNVTNAWGALSVSPVTTLPDGKYKLANGYWEVTKGKGKFYIVPTYDYDATNKNKNVSTTMKAWTITKQNDGSYYFYNKANNVYFGVSVSGTAYSVVANSSTPLPTYLFKVADVTSGKDTITQYQNYVIGATYSSGVKAVQLSSISGSEADNNGYGSAAILSVSSKKTDTKTAWAFIPVYDYWYKISAVTSSSQMGTVYASSSNKTFSSSEEKNSIEDAQSTTAYFKAIPADGYKFDGWFTNAGCTTPATGLVDCAYTDTQIAVTVSATSTDENNPTVTTLYAKFSSDAQKSDFAYTWNWGATIYGDDVYTDPITVLGENTPAYTLTANTEEYFATVTKPNNAITAITTKDYIGEEQTITFTLHSDGNAYYNAIDEDIQVTFKTAPNHLSMFINSDTEYDKMHPVPVVTSGVISCSEDGVIEIPRHISATRSLTLDWHGQAKDVLFNHIAIADAGTTTSTTTISFTWLDRTGATISTSATQVAIKGDETVTGQRSVIGNIPANARKLQMSFIGNVIVQISNLTFTENTTDTYNVSFIAPANGTYSVENIVDAGYQPTIGGAAYPTHTYDYLILTATPSTDYVVYQWYYKDANGTKLPLTTTLAPSYEGLIPTGATAVGVDFTNAHFVVNGSQLKNSLADALQAATNGSTIVLLRDYTVPAGNYTIPTGVTLLLPYKENQQEPVGMNIPYLAPEGANFTGGLSEKGKVPESMNHVEPFRTLTLANGANITVNGHIELTASQYSEGGLHNQRNGVVGGPYGHMVLNAGSKITLGSGSELRAWGYITGAGEIDARRGSTVREFFQMTDWKNGQVVSLLVKDHAGKGTSFTDDNEGVFPVSQYYIQNIESPVTYHAGSQLKAAASVFFPGMGPLIAVSNQIAIIGYQNEDIKDESMFYMNEAADQDNTWVRKYYNAVQDRQVYEINSSAYLGGFKIEILEDYRMDSRDFVLPLTNNMDIHLLKGELNITQSAVLLPGAKIENEKESTLTINETFTDSNNHTLLCALYLQDCAQWRDLAVADNKRGIIFPVTYSPSWTTCPRANITTAAALGDAELNVHGTIDIYGALYTTADGANIHSTNEDAGTVKFSNAAAANANIFHFDYSGDNWALYFAKYPVSSAQLKNANNTFTTTTSTAANTAFCYINGTWTNLAAYDCGFVKDAQGKWYIKPDAYVQVNTTKNPVDDVPQENATDHLFYDINGNTYIQDPEQCDLYWAVSKVAGQNYYLASNGKYYQYNDGWEVLTATITWLDKDGTTVIDTYENVAIGTKAQFNGTTPTHEGYNFAGWKDKDNIFYAIGSDLPIVTGNATYTAVYTSSEIGTDKEVKLGETWTVTETTALNSLTICSSTATHTSGQIVGIDKVTVTGDVNFDLTLGDNANPQKWHAFAVPFEVSVTEGVYNAETNQKLVNRKDYAFRVYDGATRADGKYGWKNVTSGNLHPGMFYVMTVNGNVKTFRFKKAQSASLEIANELPVTAYSGTGATTDLGWNGIANPTLQVGTINVPVQVLNPQSYTYELYEAGSGNFVVGTPFFYQAGTSTVLAMTAENDGKPYYAPRISDEMKALVFLSNEDYTDRLSITAANDATDTYEIGKDLVKMTMTATPAVPQIFGQAYGDQLSMVNTPLHNQEAVVALNLYAPANGTYTLSAETENSEAYLLHEGTVIWNLNDVYTLQLDKGNNAGYSILLRQAAQAPTELTTANADHTTAQKIILNGTFYIIRDGRTYSAEGQQIK